MDTTDTTDIQKTQKNFAGAMPSNLFYIPDGKYMLYFILFLILILKLFGLYINSNTRIIGTSKTISGVHGIFIEFATKVRFNGWVRKGKD